MEIEFFRAESGMRNLVKISVLILVALLSSYSVTAEEQEVTRIVRDGDIEIETFVYGDGNDTLIIAAGNGRPAAQLADLAREIAAAGIQVVTYNYRTIGASKGSINDITLHDYADDVWRIADAMGLEDVHLGGKTYGNRVMRAAAAAGSERTRSIILIGAGGEILPSEAIQAKYLRYVDPSTPKEEWQRLQGELMFAPGNEYLAARSTMLGSYPALAAAQVKATNATPMAEWAHGGQAPMLVLTCLQDLIAVPENAFNLAKSRPDTWLVGIPDCGHNMIYERPEDIAQLIVNYIGQHSADGRHD
jgi:pimeloyl-ACP methyl ester carboxylesterase